MHELTDPGDNLTLSKRSATHELLHVSLAFGRWSPGLGLDTTRARSQDEYEDRSDPTIITHLMAPGANFK